MGAWGVGQWRPEDRRCSLLCRGSVLANCTAWCCRVLEHPSQLVHHHSVLAKSVLHVNPHHPSITRLAGAYLCDAEGFSATAALRDRSCGLRPCLVDLLFQAVAAAPVLLRLLFGLNLRNRRSSLDMNKSAQSCRR